MSVQTMTIGALQFGLGATHTVEGDVVEWWYGGPVTLKAITAPGREKRWFPSTTSGVTTTEYRGYESPEFAVHTLRMRLTEVVLNANAAIDKIEGGARLCGKHT